jgi:ketosteroid isomerase-like protein
MSNQQHKDVVRRFLEALVQDDVEPVRALVRDDVVWWVPQSGVTVGGLSRPLQGWDDIQWLGGDGWKGFLPGTSSIVMHHLVAEDDLVSAHYNRVAQRPNGTHYDNEYNIMFRLVGGQIAEVWEVVDTAYALATRDQPAH